MKNEGCRKSMNKRHQYCNSFNGPVLFSERHLRTQKLFFFYIDHDIHQTLGTLIAIRRLLKCGIPDRRFAAPAVVGIMKSAARALLNPLRPYALVICI
jgi:hypothetical protein